ncbi:MAG: hypothetical protein KC940_11235, partial [Candidatus Omnitrophica bacterium]|nr:hypothetical protein [Candidatus Omnitrophota bacterium]
MNTEFRNCTITRNGFRFRTDVRMLDFSNSLVLGCIISNYFIDSSSWINGGGGPIANYSLIEGGWPGEGNIDADAMFVDPEIGDYELERGSPCIDSGTDTGLITDLDGNPRPIGGYDMGAYEFPYLR